MGLPGHQRASARDRPGARGVAAAGLCSARRGAIGLRADVPTSAARRAREPLPRGAVRAAPESSAAGARRAALRGSARARSRPDRARPPGGARAAATGLHISSVHCLAAPGRAGRGALSDRSSTLSGRRRTRGLSSRRARLARGRGPVREHRFDGRTVAASEPPPRRRHRHGVFAGRRNIVAARARGCQRLSRLHSPAMQTRGMSSCRASRR
jgi:hypothetical protein